MVARRLLRRAVSVASLRGAAALAPGVAACPVASTRAWIVDVVVGLGLCPWAGKAYASGALAVSAAAASRALPAAVDALEAVAAAPRTTAAVALTGGFGDFGDFLDLCGEVEGEIDGRGLRGTVQLATFHPRYEFGDGAEEAGHYTNRSPFPLLHFIREDDISAALAAAEDDPGAAAEAVWTRNVAVVTDIGVGEMQRRVAACFRPP
jgi:hypothetical protein